MADYYTLLTTAGIAYETACKASGAPIKLSQMSIGDGNGAVYNPDATAKALKREVWRGDINSLLQDSSNSSWLVAEVSIPDDVGGWYVREAGIWTDTGILYAIVKVPESYKPVQATSGSGKEFYLRSIFQTSNASSVTLVVDSTIVKATRAWVTDYVAAELAKLDAKQSVRAATTAAITLSGAQTVDGVALVAGDLVLVKDQAAGKDNGLYTVANGAWTRAASADISAEVTPGMWVPVEEGTANGDSIWQLTTDAPIVLGTTALKFEAVSGPTGVSVGTYSRVTVDKRGRVTAGTNPTTLDGLGITLATQDQAEAGTDNAAPMTALRVFQAIAKKIGQATETVFGWLKIATAQQVADGTDDATAVTPKKLKTALSVKAPINAPTFTEKVTVNGQLVLSNASEDTPEIVWSAPSRAVYADLYNATWRMFHYTASNGVTDYPIQIDLVNKQATFNGNVNALGYVYAGNGTGVLSTDGNIYGSMWGGWLSNYLGNVKTTQAKAWASWNGVATTPVIYGSFNILSIVDNGTGDFTFNLITPLADTNYSVVGGGSNTGSEVLVNSIMEYTGAARATTYVRLLTYIINDGLTARKSDRTWNNFVLFGN